MIKRSVYILLLTIWCISASSQGLKLFSPEMKKDVPKSQVVVMDFLERYFYELSTVKHTTIQTKMSDDKVYFRKGNMSDLSRVNDTMPFSINLYDRYYEVKWMMDDKPFVVIVFPAQYDLILGVDKDNALKQFKDCILSAPLSPQQFVLPTNLKEIGKSLFKSQNDTLGLVSLTDAIYYNKVREDYLPVFDSKHLEYSAANLFHSLITDRDYKMYVEQSVYGMTTITYTISFNQWLNYCAEWGLKTFFAIEEQREDGLLALVIAQSKELGFNHLLSVIIPDKFTTDKDAILKVRMTPYIPTHNLKNLYQQQIPKRKKIQWQ